MKRVSKTPPATPLASRAAKSKKPAVSAKAAPAASKPALRTQARERPLSSAAHRGDSLPGVGRAEKKLDKRQRIRAAAWELFTSIGFEETRTKEVAERAGIATGTLFLYAPDKTDLLCLVMHDRLVDAVDRAFLTLPRALPLVEQLLHVFRMLFAMYGEHPKVGSAFIRIVQTADGPNGREVGAMTFGFLHRLAGLVQDAIARGEVDEATSPLLCAQCFFGLYFFSLTTGLSGYLSMDAALDPHLRSTLELLMRGLAPRA